MYGGLGELTNTLSNATPYSLPFPKIGGSQPPIKTAIWLSDKIVGKFAQLYASTVSSKNVAQKNVVSGGISFVGC